MKQYESSKRAKAKYRENNREKIRQRAKEIAALKKAGTYVPIDRRLTPEQKTASAERKKKLTKEWQRNNPDRLRAANARWKEKHPGRHAESVRAYRRRNPDKVRETTRIQSSNWRKNNPGKTNRRWEEWRKTHPRDPEQHRQNGRNSYRRHKEKAYERTMRRKMRLLGVPGSHTTEEWQALCAKFDNRCVCCGERRKLTRDHVIPVTHDGSSHSILNIQPLCQACNSAKRNSSPIDYRKTPFTRKGQSVLFL